MGTTQTQASFEMNCDAQVVVTATLPLETDIIGEVQGIESWHAIYEQAPTRR
jgi:hypothetical protein